MIAATLLRLVITLSVSIYSVESSDGRPKNNYGYDVPPMMIAGSSSSNPKGSGSGEVSETPSMNKYAQKVANYNARSHTADGSEFGDDQPPMDPRSRAPKRLLSKDDVLEALNRRLQEITSAQKDIFEKLTPKRKDSSRKALKTLKIQEAQTLKQIEERQLVLNTIERQQREAERQLGPQQHYYQPPGSQQNYPPHHGQQFYPPHHGQQLYPPHPGQQLYPPHQGPPAYPPNYYPAGYNPQQYPQYPQQRPQQYQQYGPGPYPQPAPYGPPSNYMNPMYQNNPGDPRKHQ